MYIFRFLKTLVFFIFVIFTTLIFSSCNSTNRKQDENKSNIIAKEKTQKINQITGTYFANIPGANSDIKVELTLDANGKYSLSSVYVDKNPKVFTDTGSYRVDNDQLFLDNNSIAKSFEISKNYLEQLDVNENKIDTEFSERHQYTKGVLVPYILASNYFAKPLDNGLINMKIETEEEFSKYFGAATTMDKNGQPTTIDFSKKFVLAVIFPDTDFETTLNPVKLLRSSNDDLWFTYNKTVGNHLSFSIKPSLLILIDREYDGEFYIKEN